MEELGKLELLIILNSVYVATFCLGVAGGAFSPSSVVVSSLLVGAIDAILWHTLK